MSNVLVYYVMASDDDLHRAKSPQLYMSEDEYFKLQTPLAKNKNKRSSPHVLIFMIFSRLLKKTTYCTNINVGAYAAKPDHD